MVGRPLNSVRIGTPILGVQSALVTQVCSLVLLLDPLLYLDLQVVAVTRSAFH